MYYRYNDERSAVRRGTLIEISRGSSTVEDLASAPGDHVLPRTLHVGCRVVLKTLDEMTRKLAALVGRKLERLFENLASASPAYGAVSRTKCGQNRSISRQLPAEIHRPRTSRAIAASTSRTLSISPASA